MNKCKHKSSTVMEYHGNVTLAECDSGCGATLIIITDGSGIAHQITADDLLRLLKPAK